MVDLNPTRGHEQGLERPALIISDDIYNDGPAEMLIVLPITSKIKYTLPSHLLVMPPDGGLTARSHILCDQVRTISKQRLLRRMGKMPDSVLATAVGLLGDLVNAW